MNTVQCPGKSPSNADGLSRLSDQPADYNPEEISLQEQVKKNTTKANRISRYSTYYTRGDCQTTRICRINTNIRSHPKSSNPLPKGTATNVKSY